MNSHDCCREVRHGRIPDLDVQTTSGSLRIFELLHKARPILLNLATPGRFNDITGYNRLAVIDASCTGPWHLPVIGQVSDPHAVLIRPDGHVAWVDLDGSAARLDQALTKWIGTPQPSQSQPAK